MFEVGLPCYLGLNSARQFQSTSTKQGSLFQKHLWCTHASPMFPTYSHTGNIVSRSKLCLRYTAENFNENPSMRAVATFLRARASEDSSNFCEQFEQRTNFASAFKLDGTILYPLLRLLDRRKATKGLALKLESFSVTPWGRKALPSEILENISLYCSISLANFRLLFSYKSDKSCEYLKKL